MEGIIIAGIAAVGSVAAAWTATRSRGGRPHTEPEAIIMGLKEQLTTVIGERDRCRAVVDELRQRLT